jgi:AraC family transcriptional regulator of adaptative response/methylated-DNA-[protein]-cysteine methyltransferase
MTEGWLQKIEQACAILERAGQREPLARLAARFGGSPYHFHRNFKRIVGVTPREYADAFRLRAVKRELKRGAPITDAMLDSGYSSTSRFYEGAAKKLGMAPSAYKNGGNGLRVRFTIVDSALGKLLVAATGRGLCAVCMGDSADELERELRREYPAAGIERDDRALAAWTRDVLNHLDGSRPRLDLPLDIQATAFEWQVWKALASIPYGETRTYGQIARAVGRPNAARAVARACAKNRVALAIPCHRVVPARGDVGGYRWGSRRKKALLTREQGIKRREK